MPLRYLKLNLRTALCFGGGCRLLSIQGGVTRIKVDTVYASTVEIDPRWLPSLCVDRFSLALNLRTARHGLC